MNEDFYLNSADEALTFCRQMLKDGEVDFFRGQTKDWPSIAPSLLRGEVPQRQIAVKVLEHFAEWANSVPQMIRYWGNKTQITAIAQHYGIPTSFLDLTSDPAVAAVFAATSSDISTDHEAVIYCFKRSVLEALPSVAIHEIEVANLWRLKAQKGLFLEVLTEAHIGAIRSSAIRVHFPQRTMTAAEYKSIYPPRKSALEVVIDQWLYRNQVTDLLDKVTGTSLRLAIRRNTYPGVMRWRTVPEFEPSWVDWEEKWFYQDDHELIDALQDGKRLIVFPRGLSINNFGDHVRADISAILDRYEADNHHFEFEVQIDNYPVESSLATTLLNRCWDGLRIHPYTKQNVISCLVNTAIALLWRLDHPEVDWEQALWGETVSIDVSPIGGHLDAALVSKQSFHRALHDKHFGHLTSYTQRRLKTDPLYLTNFVVDPWVLFDFQKLAQMFVEEFLPSCFGWYWKSCLEENDRQLSDLWAISFNPALLGFVTHLNYRFYSPIATEADVDHVVLISSDMDESDFEEIFISCLPSILAGGDPFTVKFTDFGTDSRELWEIDEVVQQCKQILRIGGISVLDVVPGMRDPDELEEETRETHGASFGLGALHIWAIATGRFHEINGVPFGELEDLIRTFLIDLSECNVELDRRAKSQTDWPGPN